MGMVEPKGVEPKGVGGLLRLETPIAEEAPSRKRPPTPWRGKLIGLSRRLARPSDQGPRRCTLNHVLRVMLLAVAALLATSLEMLRVSGDETTATAAPPTAAAPSAEQIAALERSLAGAALVGHFTITGEENNGKPSEERYELGEVKHLGGEQWLLPAHQVRRARRHVAADASDPLGRRHARHYRRRAADPRPRHVQRPGDDLPRSLRRLVERRRPRRTFVRRR